MSGSQLSARRLVTVLISAVMVLSVVGMGGAGLAGAQETDTQPTYELQFDGNSDTPYAFGVPGPTDQTFGEFITGTNDSTPQVGGAAGGTIYELENGAWNQVTAEDNVVGLQAYVLTGNEDTVQAQAQIAQDDEGQFDQASLALDAGANFVTPTAQGEVGNSTTFQISDGDATQVQNPYAEPSISQGSESSFNSTPVSGSTETVNPFAGYFLVSDSGVYTSTINTGNDQAAATVGLNLDPDAAPDPASFAVSINDGTSTSDVIAGEDAIINATITNNGELTATQTINFTVNDTNEGSVDVTDLVGDASEDVEFNYTTETVDDGATAEISSDNADANRTLSVQSLQAALPADDGSLSLEDTAYTGDITVSANNTTISGAGETETTIDGNVTIEGDDNTIEDLTVVGDITDNGTNTTQTNVTAEANSPTGNVELNGDNANLNALSAADSIEINGANARVNGSSAANNISVTGSNANIQRSSADNSIDIDGSNATVEDSSAANNISVTGSNANIQRSSADNNININGSNATVEDSSADSVTVGSNGSDTALGNVTSTQELNIDESVEDTVEILPTFTVADLDPLDATVNASEEFDVSVTVENTGGNGTQTVDLALEPDGETVASQEVTLNDSEQTTVTFENVSVPDTGSYNHTVATEDDSVTGTLSVRAQELDSFNASVSPDQPVTQGDSLEVLFSDATDPNGETFTGDNVEVSVNTSTLAGYDSGPDTVTVNFDGGGATPVVTLLDGNATESINAQDATLTATVSGDVATDNETTTTFDVTITDAPEFQTATVEDASPNEIVVSFDEDVRITGNTIDAADFFTFDPDETLTNSPEVAGDNLTVVDGNVIVPLNAAIDASDNETLTNALTYAAGSDTVVAQGDDTPADAFSNENVTNNVEEGTEVETSTADINRVTFADGNSQSDSVTILGTFTNTADETLSSITVGFGNIAGNIGLGNVETDNIEIGNAGAGNVKIGNSGTVAVGNVEVGNSGDDLTVSLSDDINLGNVEDNTEVNVSIDDVDTTNTDTSSATVSVSFEDTDGNTVTDETEATVSADTTAPTVNSFQITNSDPSDTQDITVELETTEQLNGIDVSVSGAEGGSLVFEDFSESGSGPYAYTATYDSSTDGEYTVTLDTATDGAGNDGASSESDTVTVDTTGPEFGSLTSPSDSTSETQPTITVDGVNDETSSVDASTVSVTVSENGGSEVLTASDADATDGLSYDSGAGTISLDLSTTGDTLNAGTTYDVEVTADDDLSNSNSKTFTSAFTVSTTSLTIDSATFTDGNSQTDSVTILGTVTNAADETLSSITVGFGNIAGNIGLGNVEAGNIEIGNAGAGNVKIGNSGRSEERRVGKECRL